MFQKFMCCNINLIEASFNYIILGLHILASRFYIVVCIKLSLELLYLVILWYPLSINDNSVIKVDCKPHSPYIIGHIVELLRPNCRGLDSPGLSSEVQHSI